MILHDIIMGKFLLSPEFSEVSMINDMYYLCSEGEDRLSFFQASIAVSLTTIFPSSIPPISVVLAFHLFLYDSTGHLQLKLFII